MQKLNKGLSEDEITSLDKAFIQLFKLHNKLKLEMPIARYIKFPSIPSILSESMVILGAHKLFELETSWDAFRGGRSCDVLHLNDESNKQLVEVKATGEKETLELKARDIEKEWLVWIAFGARYANGYGQIVFYVLHYPYNYLDANDPTNRITNLTKFLKKIGNTKDLSIFNFDSLEAFFCAIK